MKKYFLLSILLAFSATSSFAGKPVAPVQGDDDFFQIDTIEVEEVQDSPGWLSRLVTKTKEQNNPHLMHVEGQTPPWLDKNEKSDDGDDDLPPWLNPDNGNGTGSGNGNRNGTGSGSTSAATSEARAVIATARDLIALGEDFYRLIEKGKPTSDVNIQPISVLPRQSNGEPVDELETEYWKRPKSKRYSIRLKNLYGMTVTRMVFNVNFSYGGSYMGKGAYLKGVQITLDDVWLAWGFNLEASFKLAAITNEATSEDPVAGATIEINYRVKSVMSLVERHKLFFVTGKGEITRIQSKEIEQL